MVDFDFSCSTACPVLLWLIGIWQKRLCSWARWWNTQIKVNPSLVSQQMKHPVQLKLCPLHCTLLFLTHSHSSCFSALLFSSSAGAAALAAPGSGGTAGGFAPSGRSSGRSSNCDEHEMQSDVSIEEDLNELNQKVGKARISLFMLAGYLKLPFDCVTH